MLLKKNCDVDATDDDGKRAIDVARDEATLAQLNAIYHGNPSVQTLALREAVVAAEQAELAEELAEFDFLNEDGEIEDSEIHALAVSESVRETYHLVELTPEMWEVAVCIGLMNCVSKMMDYAFKMMDFVFKTMIWMQISRIFTSWWSGLVRMGALRWSLGRGIKRTVCSCTSLV